MQDMQTELCSLQLDRGLANLSFESWRLTHGLVKGCNVVPLAGMLGREDGETDYIHTRLAALYNHLIAQPGGHYLYVRIGEAMCLQQLQQLPGAASPTLATVAVLEPLPPPETPLAPVEPALPASIAEVAVASAEGAPQQPPGALLLVSRGQGDLMLAVRGAEGGAAAVSGAVYPLRPPAPGQGCRTFYLEAAFQVAGASSDVMCVLWSVRARTDTAPSRCEVYAVTLALTAGAGGAQGAGPGLEVRGVKLLKRSSITPHGVLVNPSTASILLALEPVADSEKEANGPRPPLAQTLAEPVDDGEDPVSPRTLQAAVARLAQFTSQEPAGDLPGPGKWTDLYSESGPDGVGDMGQEPSCTLYFFDAGLSCVDQIPCLPHKVLACHRHAGSLLLGLTDDVDSALVELAPAPASMAAAAAEGAAGAGAGSIAGFSVRHVSSIPALAYVAAGKLQRKYLLLSPPGGPLAAALVESQRFAYLYTPTAPGQAYGNHEVLELGLPEGSPGVQGAALLGAGGAGSGQGQQHQLLLLAANELRAYIL